MKHNVDQRVQINTAKFKKLLEELVLLEEIILQHIILNKDGFCLQSVNKYCFLHREEIYNKLNTLNCDNELSFEFNDILSDITLSMDSRLVLARLLNSKIYGVNDVQKAILRIKEISYLVFMYKKFMDIDTYISTDYRVNKISVNNMLQGISGEFESCFDDVELLDGKVTPAQFIERFESLTQLSKTVLNTGMIYLDKLIENGYKAGDLLIIGARPGGGKTAFCIDLLVKNKSLLESTNKICCYFTPDMSIVNMYYRLVARLTGIQYNHVHKTNKQEFCEKVKSFPIIMSPVFNLSEILLIVEGMKEQLSVIIIDYIQIIRCDTKNTSRTEEIGYIISKLKEFARKNGILLIFVAQLNRETEKKPEFSLSDLRDSGFLEQEADIVLFLNKNLDNTVDLQLMKNRYGPCAEVKATFNPSNFSFL